MGFQDVAEESTRECVARDEYASVVLRIRKFIANAEGENIQEALSRQLAAEMQRMKDLSCEAYIPENAAELAVVSGRVQVLEWLTNGQFGFAQVEA